MRILFLSILICYAKFFYGQDTLTYCQKNSPWITNCYSFYKVSKDTNCGTFNKYMESDDGQKWYGIGNFIERKNKIIIYSFKLIRTLDNIVMDSTIIQSLSFIKQKGCLFQDEKHKSNKLIFIRQKSH